MHSSRIHKQTTTQADHSGQHREIHNSVSVASLTAVARYISDINHFCWGCHICKMLSKICETYEARHLERGSKEGEDEDEGNVPLIDDPADLPEARL